MNLIGNKKKVAIELGEYWQESKQNQYINIWVGEKNITSVDDVVYLPTFYNNLNNDIEKLEAYEYVEFGSKFGDETLFHYLEENDEDRYRVLLLDLTTMSARCYYIYGVDKSYILFSYWDKRHEPSDEIGKVFRVDIEKDEFINVLKSVLDKISTTWY